MTQIPFRFMGYAYCMGDLLIELDTAYKIINIDGAVNSMLGSDQVLKMGDDFTQSLSDTSKHKVLAATKVLTGHNRVGPLDIEICFEMSDGIGGKAMAVRKFIGFFSHIPLKSDRYYLALTRPSKYGTNVPSKKIGDVADSDQRSDFFEQLENVFDGEAAADNVLVTVFDDDNQEHSAREQREIQNCLSSFSLGGNHAAILADGKYAVVREKGQPALSKDVITKEIEKTTGIQLNSATLDASEMVINSEDGMRAMIFGLQQFADNVEEFNAQAFETNGTQLLEEASKKVQEFRSIIEGDKFSLVFQPIVDLKTGDTHHFEALARFQHLGLSKSPFETIVFAEQTGLIDEFDLAILDKALEKLIELEKRKSLKKIAINVSGKSISRISFVNRLMSRLEKMRRFSEVLAIELTESTVISDIKATADAVKRIRKYGYKVYLDDFGAGASGFQYLKKLKVDALKIDGDYIKDALSSREDRAFLNAMVTLCKELGIKTVAEWVETDQHAKLMTEMGVDYGQGYYFGMPQASMIGAGRIHKAS
ncbi:EAL domain-containing protein [Kordiimonas sp. SCSIO 12610]|uniref:EAL domain-containing protein n=1 Tax=Kordiimonas sp. SCSIO 12610 TaxID=2829597 RepID=UPI00210EA6EE|nr:EAL domain-containing protein [Kordiimonas sp. SCSIO 12610]UTW55771.1 EAL domain-containing protein [Kordiimonas sp. SCSIO 12610]